MIGIALLAILLVMVGAPLHEAFEIHDTKSFPVDPEFLLVVFGSLLTMCLSVVLLALSCLVSSLVLAYVLAFWLNPTALSYCSAFHHERLLFSPPGSTVSLRI